MAPRVQNAAQAQQVLAANNYDINSLMGGWVDRGTWIYYDTATIAAGAAVPQAINFFQIGLGGNDAITGNPKTKLQTNLPNGGFFNPPRCLILNQLGFMFTGPSSTSTVNHASTLLTDVEMFVNSCYFEFTIDSKIFFEGLLQFHPPGYGVYGFSTRHNEETWGVGFPSPSATYKFGNYGKFIAPLQNFALKITFPGNTLPLTSSAGEGVNLVAIMKGLTDRSVQ